MAHLLGPDLLSWDERKLEALFKPNDVEAIRGLDVSAVSCVDKLCWITNDDDKFSVNSCFGLLQGTTLNQEKDVV